MNKHKIFGMTNKDLKTLKKLLSVPYIPDDKPKTASDFLNAGLTFIEEFRTTKKTQLVRLSNDKWYEMSKLETTNYFEY